MVDKQTKMMAVCGKARQLFVPMPLSSSITKTTLHMYFLKDSL
jgi:hypothetical protein